MFINTSMCKYAYVNIIYVNVNVYAVVGVWFSGPRPMKCITCTF